MRTRSYACAPSGPLHAVGVWYEDFAQTSDEEVRALLELARKPPGADPRHDAQPLTGVVADYDTLLERAAGARFVLIGEASHGTHEFYRERAEITRRLIAEAVLPPSRSRPTGPDAYRVNSFVRAGNEDSTPEEALADFRRFPSWMWRNTEVADFLGWLREWNDALPPDAPKTGFYGLDLYSLHSSMEAVIDYLEEVDPDAAERARERYSCFDQLRAVTRRCTRTKPASGAPTRVSSRRSSS